VERLEAERAPTIIVIKNGAVAARKAGLMNPKEMKAFFAAA
jgi:thioredoxin 1